MLANPGLNRGDIVTEDTQEIYLSRHGITYANVIVAMLGSAGAGNFGSIRSDAQLRWCLAAKGQKPERFFRDAGGRMDFSKALDWHFEDLTPNGYLQADILADYLNSFVDCEDLNFVRSDTWRTLCTMEQIRRRLGEEFVRRPDFFFSELNEEVAREHSEGQPGTQSLLRSAAEIGEETERNLVTICNQFYPHNVLAVTHANRNQALLEYLDKDRNHNSRWTDNCGLWVLENDGTCLRIVQTHRSNNNLYRCVQEIALPRTASGL
ncbi:MAG: histidine phosphatase family protein, partial [Nanoarchaeota archaeon]|nr:histidine phosphatase family protein [Nanoarchaeota archaeon]